MMQATRLVSALLLAFLCLCAKAIAATDEKAVAAKAEAKLAVDEGAKLTAKAIELEAKHGNATQLWFEAAALGNETAQYVVGVMQAWGLNGVERDDSKAILSYYFSALGGYVPAMMALGYRHLRGDGVPANCKTAAMYLELASNKVIDNFVQTGGVEPSFAAERIHAPDEAKSEQKAYSDTDVVDYYHNLASKGDSQATGTLGRIYYFGARGVERDVMKAYAMLLVAASKGDVASLTSLGHILLKGYPPSIERDHYHAFTNFTAAAEAGNGAAFNGLGYMYLIGFPGVVEQDLGEALKMLTKATDAGVPEALYNMGSIYASSFKQTQRDFAKAYRYFGLAAQKGSLLALHKVAHMTLHGIGTMKSCKTAAQYFKTVSERGLYSTDATQWFAQAFASFRDAPLGFTLERYLRLAEMGYEAGETNSARVLDEITSKMYTDELRASFVGSLHTILDAVGMSHPPLTGSADALRLYERAAEQGNFKARVKVGDYFFYGHGDVEPDMIEAAAHYRLASEGRDAQANFNLGLQHHYGLGLAKDPHLAKRYYDLASEASPDARFPVAIASGLLWLETAQKALVTGEKVVADDPAMAGWVEWWQKPSRWLPSLNWIMGIQGDTIVIGGLIAAFLGLGYYRELRHERRRRMMADTGLRPPHVL